MSDQLLLLQIAEDVGGLKADVRNLITRLEEGREADAAVEARVSSLEGTRAKYEGARGLAAGAIAFVVSWFANQ